MNLVVLSGYRELLAPTCPERDALHAIARLIDRSAFLPLVRWTDPPTIDASFLFADERQVKPRLDLFLDYLAVRLNGAKAGDRAITLVLTLPDAGVTRTLMVRNGALSYHDGAAADAHARVTLDRTHLDDVILGVAPIADQLAVGRATIEGDAQALRDFVGLLDTFEFWFNIATP